MIWCVLVCFYLLRVPTVRPTSTVLVTFVLRSLDWLHLLDCPTFCNERCNICALHQGTVPYIVQRESVPYGFLSFGQFWLEVYKGRPTFVVCHRPGDDPPLSFALLPTVLPTVRPTSTVLDFARFLSHIALCQTCPGGESFEMCSRFGLWSLEFLFTAISTKKLATKKPIALRSRQDINRCMRWHYTAWFVLLAKQVAGPNLPAAGDGTLQRRRQVQNDVTSLCHHYKQGSR